MTVAILSPRAESDLEDIGDYIAQDNPARAVQLIERLRDKGHEIARHPDLYRLRSELGRGRRSCPVGSYVIFFRKIGPQAILIERILPAARDIDADYFSWWSLQHDTERPARRRTVAAK